MEITQVKIFPVQEDKLKAFVSVVFDQCFMVNDIKVIQGKDGLFLSMPSRRKKSGEFKDVAHPLNNEMRRRLEERVLGEYREIVNDPTPRRPDREDDDARQPSPAAFGPGPAVPQPNAPQSAASQPAPPRPGAAQPPAGQPAYAHAESRPGAAQPVGPPAPKDGAGRGASEHQTSETKTSETKTSETKTSETQASEAQDEEDERQKTLEEVQEMHLRDSFWSVS